MTEMGSGTVLSVRTGEGSGCGGGPHGTIYRSDETGGDQKASDSAHLSRSGNTGWTGGCLKTREALLVTRQWKLRNLKQLKW